MSEFTLHDLERIVAQRAASGDANSWTAKLFSARHREGGQESLARKAVETVIAALGEDHDEIVSESADLLYHWLVVLALRQGAARRCPWRNSTGAPRSRA